MIDRRTFIAGLGAVMTGIGTVPTLAHHTKKFRLISRCKPQMVTFSGYGAGTVVVDPRNHFLYLQLRGGKARRYGVGVGRAGLAFRRKAMIWRKAKWPRWTPTRNMIRRQTGKYAKIAGGVPGGPSNPLGSRALYLYRNGRDTLYRIHGTTQPSSIGRSVPNGYSRMLNEHVQDLYERVRNGMSVVVLKSKLDSIEI